MNADFLFFFWRVSGAVSGVIAPLLLVAAAVFTISWLCEIISKVAGSLQDSGEILRLRALCDDHDIDWRKGR
jgi:hypothetical protein